MNTTTPDLTQGEVNAHGARFGGNRQMLNARPARPHETIRNAAQVAADPVLQGEALALFSGRER